MMIRFNPEGELRANYFVRRLQKDLTPIVSIRRRVSTVHAIHLHLLLCEGERVVYSRPLGFVSAEPFFAGEPIDLASFAEVCDPRDRVSQPLFFAFEQIIRDEGELSIRDEYGDGDVFVELTIRGWSAHIVMGRKACRRIFGY